MTSEDPSAALRSGSAPPGLDDPDLTSGVGAAFAGPRRLHVAAAVLNGVVALRGLAFPLLAAVFVGGSGGGLGRALLFGTLGAVAALVTGVVAWRSTRYELADGALRFRRGTFSPDETVVPVTRIQALDTVQGPIQRLFGAVELHVQTPGGGADGEIVLAAVSPADARALRAALGHPEPERGGAHRRLGSGALLLAALTAPQFGVVLPVVGAAFAGANDLLGRDLIDEGLLDRFDTPGEAATALALVLGATFAISFGAAIVAFAGFEAELEGDRLRLRRGLLQRRTASVPVGRIDGVAIVEGLLRAPLGLATVRLESAGYRAEASAARTLFPLVRTRDVPALLAELVPGLDGCLPPLVRPARRGLRGYVAGPALAGAATGVASALALTAVGAGAAAWLAVPVLATLGAAHGGFAFRAAGLHLGPERVVLRTRRGTTRVTLLTRRHRLQETSVRRTVLQRRAGLATFGLALGSGRRGRVRHLEAGSADTALAALRTARVASRSPGVEGSPMATAPVARTPEDLTEGWLAEALDTGPVSSFTVTPVGTGQMSQSHRVALEYADGGAGPASVVAKFAASDPTSRATGVGMGAYEREIRFYVELAPRLGQALPACHAARFEPQDGWFTLLLEDVAPAVQGDQIAGCTPEQARIALVALAGLHAPVLGDPGLGATPWLNQPNLLDQALLTQLLPGFEERYAGRVTDEHLALTRRFLASLDGWAGGNAPPLGLVHGDYRLDNLLFGEPGSPRPFTAVDWQTVGWGPVMLDASYFLGGGLTVEDRRAHEEELVRAYHEALGVPGFSWEQCWEDYRRQSFHGVLMAVAASMLVQRTERGDEMFMTTLARHAQQAIDLDAVALLPAEGAGRPPALRPEPADEGRHPAGPEELWNESWYFDAVARDGSVGAYVRLGLYPNLGAAWYTAFVCGPDRATVAVVDFQAKLPEGEQLSTRAGGGDATHACEAPLERFRVTLQATGEAHEDPAAFLREEPGRPVPVALDLTWDTHGEPYAYRLATRYEIPCTVSGTLAIDGDELVLDAVGQRDHSWGTRDWWSMDWVWSAGHLDDGTRFHAVELRLPDAPRIGVGYVQPPEGGLVELDRVAATEEVGADGLITAATLELDPGGLRLQVEPTAFGPLRLVAPDGRASSFPRAMCRVTAPDGRTGWAWLEWNRNTGA